MIFREYVHKRCGGIVRVVWGEYPPGTETHCFVCDQCKRLWDMEPTYEWRRPNRNDLVIVIDDDDYPD